jgi:hypothetical protein
MNLEGIRYYYLPAPGGIGGAGIVIGTTPELLELQAKVISAAAPFTVKSATIAAIIVPHDAPPSTRCCSTMWKNLPRNTPVTVTSRM